MVARVSALLHEAAEVRRLCAELLALLEPLNDNQRDFIKKIASNAIRFSSLVTEMADFLDSGSPEIRGMSHDLHMPITAIRGYTDVVTKLCGPFSETQREYLAQIENNGKKLTILVISVIDNAAPRPDA